MVRPKAKELTQRELELMQVFWNSEDEMTAQQVRERLEVTGRELAYTTVATLIRILIDKDFVEQTHDERPFRYTAKRSFSEVSSNLVSDLIERVFGGSRELFLMNLIGQQKLSKPERELLEQVLREQK